MEKAAEAPDSSADEVEPEAASPYALVYPAGTSSLVSRVTNDLSRGTDVHTNLNKLVGSGLNMPVFGSLQRWAAQQAEIIGPSLRSLNAQLAVPLSRLASIDWKSLSDAQAFRNASVDPSSYSDELESAASYFGHREVTVRSFADLNRQIGVLIDKNPDMPLVWRGMQRATWGLHSSLFRLLMDRNGVESPDSNPRPRGLQSYPDEDQMVTAEKTILEIARDEWRMDGLSALEIFARIQHVGGPTRLLDVSHNPYIASWFAVEQNGKHDDHDGRLFALGTRPVGVTESSEFADTRLRLDDVGGGRNPFWHGLTTDADRQTLEWGTGALRRLWVPPAYDPRILAQNAAFILDGVPMTSSKTARYFKKDDNKGTWTRSDLLASASFYAKTYNPAVRPRANNQNLSPVFSFRLTSEAKTDIRRVLESNFGYRQSTIYPDVPALARQLFTQL